MGNRKLETRSNSLPIRGEVVQIFESLNATPVVDDGTLRLANKVSPGILITGSTARYAALSAYGYGSGTDFPPPTDLDLVTLRDGAVVKGGSSQGVASDIRHIVNLRNYTRYLHHSTCTGLDQIFLGRVSELQFPQLFFTNLAADHLQRGVVAFNPDLIDYTNLDGLLRPSSVFRAIIQHLRLKEFGFTLEADPIFFRASLLSNWSHPRTSVELYSALSKADYSNVREEFECALARLGFSVPKKIQSLMRTPLQ